MIISGGNYRNGRVTTLSANDDVGSKASRKKKKFRHTFREKRRNLRRGGCLLYNRSKEISVRNR